MGIISPVPVFTLMKDMDARGKVANAAFLTVSGGFDDVDYDSWYFADVDAAAAAGLMGGTTETQMGVVAGGLGIK